jgi:hypothetical protein
MRVMTLRVGQEFLGVAGIWVHAAMIETAEPRHEP